MARPRTADQLQLVLQVMPWLSQQDGPVHIDVVAQRFNVSPKTLWNRLSTVTLVGPQPQSPELMCEILLDDNTVEVTVDPYFDRHARLTPEEGLELISAGMSLVEDAPEDDPLISAVHKIAQLFDMELGDDIVVETSASVVVQALDISAAIAAREILSIKYLNVGSGELSERNIEPLDVFTQNGNWYLHAWCQKAGALRTFRLDRIESLIETGSTFDIRPDLEPRDRNAYIANPKDQHVVLALSAELLWLTEHLPCEKVEIIDDPLPHYGRDNVEMQYRVTLSVSNMVWLQSLLLQLGNQCAILESDPPLPSDFISSAATRLLDIYS